jgi:hypothetical protein
MKCLKFIFRVPHSFLKVELVPLLYQGSGLFPNRSFPCHLYDGSRIALPYLYIIKVLAGTFQISVETV